MSASVERIREYGAKGKEKKLFGLLNNKNPVVRAEAARALGGIKTEESFNKLIIMLNDPDLEVRKSTVEGLGQQGNNKAREFLRHAMKQESDPNFQELARNALAKLPPS